MSTPTFQNVQPLIVEQRLNESALDFTFECPVSGHRVQASQAVSETSDPKAQMAGKAKRAALFSMRGSVSSAIRRAFGSSTLGRMLGDVASTAAYIAATPSSQGSSLNLSKQQEQEAAVAAFRSVAAHFTWNAQRGAWIASKTAEELVSPFERQLDQHPLEANYDREVAARMLVEIAMSDGVLAPEECRYFEQFIDPSVGSIKDLAERPPLTRAELAETGSAGVRTSMLMLCWILALADDDFAAEESALLERFADSLELPDSEADLPRSLALGFLIDQLLVHGERSGDATATRAAVRRFAERAGLSLEEAEQAEARFRKRRTLTTV